MQLNKIKYSSPKRFLLILSLFFFIFSCKTKSKNEKKPENIQSKVTDTTKLIKGKWNGEYLKISSESPKRKEVKGNSSQFFSMGKVHITIGTDPFIIKTYQKSGTVLSFSSNTINAFAKGIEGKQIALYFQKKNNSKAVGGTFQITKNGAANNTVRIILQNKDQKYALTKGTAKIISFSPQKSHLTMEFKGEAKDKTGKIINCEGKLDIQFEEAVKITENY